MLSLILGSTHQRLLKTSDKLTYDGPCHGLTILPRVSIKYCYNCDRS
jgi:hypothetical protein